MISKGLVVCLAGALGLSAADVSFDKQVKPILEARCLKCHGAAMQLAKLDLRTREAAFLGGEKGPAIVDKKPEESRLFRRVAGLEKPAMPMDGPLSAAEVEILKSWIAQGAPWGAVDSSKTDTTSMEDMTLPEDARKYWAFQKPVRGAVPKSSDAAWNRNPIDAFLRKAMDDRGLTPAPPTDRNTLMRRAYLDLIGLPPTPEEAKLFLDDTAPGAWERLIDRLLASPHYGERWGRHWLDVARYADSNGFEHDFDRPNAWRYRDYVIQSFNAGKPFDKFLREQIAGDELDTVNYETLIATAFLRNYAKVGFREKDNPQYRYDYLDDMIATMGRGILGLTIQCARCHNHKYDPIAQKDYYRLQASLYGYVEVEHPMVPADQAAAYQAKLDDIEARLKPRQEQMRQIEAPHRYEIQKEKVKRYPKNIQEAVLTPEDKRTPGQVLLANQILRTMGVSSGEIERLLTPEQVATVRRLRAEIRDIEKEKPEAIATAMGITDGDYRFVPDGAGDEPAPGKGVKQEVTEGSFLADGKKPYQVPPSYFLVRGDIQSRGSKMQPGFPMVLVKGTEPVELPPANGRTSGRRRALAEWLVSRDNPLTARVFVNRAWHHHFGRGIVSSLDNFGKNGDRPTHQELLDWLAVEFMESGWDVKKLHRLVMTSRAYQMSSQFDSAGNLSRDSENIYLWRFRQQRLEAEIVRDVILASSGSLNLKMSGPPVFPKLPTEILESMKYGIWTTQADGPEVWRRSVYIYRKRGLPFPMLETFDLPDQNIACGRRNVSTVPTQALTLLHNEMVLQNARLFAARLDSSAPGDTRRQLDLAYQIALSRLPTEQERTIGLEFLKRQSLTDLAHVILNLNEFIYLR